MTNKLIIETINQIKKFSSIKSDETFFVRPKNSTSVVITSTNENHNCILFHKEVLDYWDKLVKSRQFIIHEQAFTDNILIILSFFNALPFIIIQHLENRIVISIREFKTDDLPRDAFTQLEDMLTSDFSDLKSKMRPQDLRLFGFLDSDNEENKTLIESYVKASNKMVFLRKVVLKLEYFKVIIFCLDQLIKLLKRDKKNVLEELGQVIVKNSQGDNLMVESVSKKRTANILSILEYFQLIDHNWIPIHSDNKDQEQQVRSKIRDYFLKISNEYLSAKQEGFGGHSLASFIRHDVPLEINKLSFLDHDIYTVTASGGMGNWAAVPWIAILNNQITNSTQRGYYLVYLFSEDMKRLYLSFAQGVTETSREDILRIKQEIRDHIIMDSLVKKDDAIANSARHCSQIEINMVLFGKW